MCVCFFANNALCVLCEKRAARYERIWVQAIQKSKSRQQNGCRDLLFCEQNYLCALQRYFNLVQFATELFVGFSKVGDSFASM